MTWHEISVIAKNRRKKLKLTQEQLAEKANVSIISVQRVEMGTKVSIKTLIKIVGVLNEKDEVISLEDIIELSYLE